MNVVVVPGIWTVAKVLGVLVVFAFGALFGTFFVMERAVVGAGDGHVTAADHEARLLANRFAAELDHPDLVGAAVAMVVLDESGDIWFASPQAHTSMIPASALKILTTGAALSILGPDFRFVTRFASPSSSAPDLDGDLVILGGGDPTLSSARLGLMVDELVKRGIRKIDGRVIADATVFPECPMSDHWNWGDVGNAYGAGAYGLNVDHNRLVLGFRPGASVGEAAHFSGASIELPGVEWVNHVTTGAVGSGDRVVVYSEPYGKRVTMRGTVPVAGGEHAVRAAIPDPPSSAVSTVRKALEKRGIEITGRMRHSASPDQVLVESASVPLMEIIRNIHHTSDNLEAQCVFLALASGGDPAAVVRDHWRGEGVDFVALRMLDGSGLARANTIRAVDIARVMHAALAAPHGREFYESLPVYQDGLIRSKPGWMSGVVTSVGVITQSDGTRMTYAFMSNSVADANSAKDMRNRLRSLINH